MAKNVESKLENIYSEQKNDVNEDQHLKNIFDRLSRAEIKYSPGNERKMDGEGIHEIKARFVNKPGQDTEEVIIDINKKNPNLNIVSKPESSKKHKHVSKDPATDRKKKANQKGQSEIPISQKTNWLMRRLERVKNIVPMQSDYVKEHIEKYGKPPFVTNHKSLGAGSTIKQSLNQYKKKH